MKKLPFFKLAIIQGQIYRLFTNLLTSTTIKITHELSAYSFTKNST